MYQFEQITDSSKKFSIMVTLLFGIFFFGLSLYLYLTWNFDYWRKRGVVGPTPHIYVGTFPKTALMDKSSNYISETSEIFRLVFCFILPYLINVFVETQLR